MTIQEEIRGGVAYQVAQAQGSLGEGESVYSLPPCEFASAMQNADCILKYLDSKGVVIKSYRRDRIDLKEEISKSEKAALLAGYFLARADCERLVEE